MSDKDDPFEAANRPLDKKLLRYVWRHTRREQIWILFVILVSMPPYFMALQLPVQIINQPIQGVGFEDATATQPFLRTAFVLPEFLGGGGAETVLFEGFELERLPYLLALSLTFLSLVCINGLFKFYINTYKGRLGERMLRRMRYQLTDRVLRFPINHFRRVKGSEIASMIKDEIEPFGEFIGDAFVQPAFLGGQALVAFAFILTQSFWLGMIAVAIIAVQVTLIPYLRRRVLELGRMRQLTARLLSGRIGEIVEGIMAVHVNDTSNYERAELSNRLGEIFFIRYELYQRKFFIKFINNFLAQLTPFLFYVVGGYFAIRGTLNVGQLIGVINAYKDLPTPINGLVMWDQKRVDINIKYAQIIEQFNVPNMLDARMQAPSDDKVEPLSGQIDVSNLNVIDETGSVLIEDADFSLDLKDVTAAVGPIGSGAGAMANTLAGLYTPTSGRVLLDGKPIARLPESVRGRRFAYAGSESYLPQATLLETLLYPNKHMPLRPREDVDATTELHANAFREAEASGNTHLDYYSDWVDYEAMGLENPEDVYPRIHEILEMVELDQSVYELAMRQALSPKTNKDLCVKLLEARKIFSERLPGSGLSEFVEPFDLDKYNPHATIADNLLFGTAVDDGEFDGHAAAANQFLRGILDDTGLEKKLFDMGVELAETAIDLFSDLSPDNQFFEQLNFMKPDQLEIYPAVVSRARDKGFEGVSESDKQMLLRLSFAYSEPRNRLGLMDEETEKKILEARKLFHDTLPENLQEAMSLYEPDAYSSATSVQDNILFGRIAYGFSDATEKVQKTIRELLIEMGLEEEIFRVGLDFDIGSGGKRFSENQRQRVVLARALLKSADLLIVNRALNALDSKAQERLTKRVVNAARGKDGERSFGLLWVLASPALAVNFDSLLLFDRGKLVEKGLVAELSESSEHYSDLVN